MFKDNARSLLSNDYIVIPIKPNAKIPAIQGWQNISKQACASNISKWNEDFSNHGIGILTSTTPCIDVDVKDEKLANHILLKIISLLPENKKSKVIIRTGAPPKFLIPFQLPSSQDPYAKKIIMVNEDDSSQKIEILGKGQMALFYGIHPDTNKPYDLSMNLPKQSDLPVLTEDIIIELYSTFHINQQDLSSITTITSKTISSSEPSINIDVMTMKSILDDINKQYPKPNHDEWLTVGMALHHQYRGDHKGELLWHYFSQKNPITYDPKEINIRYNSFKPDVNTYTLGTLKYMTYTYQQRQKQFKFEVT